MGEALEANLSENALVLDAAIQRFEFCFEMCWKTLKRFLQAQGVRTITPKEAFRKAFEKGWVEKEEKWLEMLDDWNRTSHTYKKEIAMEVYGHLRGYLKDYQRLIEILKTST